MDVSPAPYETLVRRGTRVPDDSSVSICILVLDRTEMALGCLDALRRPGASPPGTELVVVANGTPSDQLDGLTAHEDVVLVVNQENLGFAAGCNQAASIARAPLLVFLNDDSTVDTGCIDALIRAVSDDPEIGAVGARIVWDDGTLQEAGSVLWRDGSTSHVGEGLPPGSDAYQEPREVDYASANGLLLTRRGMGRRGWVRRTVLPRLLRGCRPMLGLGRARLRNALRAAGSTGAPRNPELVDGLSRFSLDSEPPKAGREMGSGPRPLRVSAPEGLWTRIRRRSSAGDQAGRCARDLVTPHDRRIRSREPALSGARRPRTGGRRPAGRLPCLPRATRR